LGSDILVGAGLKNLEKAGMPCIDCRKGIVGLILWYPDEERSGVGLCKQF
jgi:hypothetical protein